MPGAPGQVVSCGGAVGGGAAAPAETCSTPAATPLSANLYVIACHQAGSSRTAAQGHRLSPWRLRRARSASSAR